MIVESKTLCYPYNRLLSNYENNGQKHIMVIYQQNLGVLGCSTDEKIFHVVYEQSMNPSDPPNSSTIQAQPELNPNSVKLMG